MSLPFRKWAKQRAGSLGPLVPASVLALIACLAPLPSLRAADGEIAVQFRKDIKPLLEQYCYDCHGDGMDKGNVAFDAFSEEELIGKKELWFSVLKNIRSGIMPPPKKSKPTEEEKALLEAWVKHGAFGLDPENPDPGRVTLRRLNRIEYRNTIRDLTGYDYNVEEELPPDDTGFGFDNIGDVLAISPLLLEKYMQAAETIVAGGIPRVPRVVAEESLSGSSFRNLEGKKADRLSFYSPATLTNSFNVSKEGTYRIVFDFQVLGQFDFDPGRCQVSCKIDGQEVLQTEFGWQNGKRLTFDAKQTWQPGLRQFEVKMEPLVEAEKKKNSLDLRLNAVRIEGPLEEQHWIRPRNFERFFTKDPPEAPEERRQYAREVLGRFAKKAYRRPVAEATVERLVKIAEEVYNQPDKRFEDGIAQAIIPILASPRFLFRTEEAESESAGAPFALVDEFALASRLSYFFWSTMPDDELFRLAGKHELRKNLGAQVKRMLADRRSDALVQNFVGQWLQVRDVEGIDINGRVVIDRDRGVDKERRALRAEFEKLRAEAVKPNDSATEEEKAARTARIAELRQRLNRVPIELDGELRRALRLETEMFFGNIVREDRSVLELLDSDYTFLNEKLARHYGMTNITGGEMRRVSLPADSPRGGILTHGSVLVVTSNPTRTSPVKRGLFVLDNVLGHPAPPPPPDVPLLEEAEKEFKDREPTLRETLELHRNKPLCSSCHNRMDPLGFALENFNALGMWRETERGQSIDSAGQLITGEKFQDIRDLKKVLVSRHSKEFYHCLTEKLMTYALGRGMDYYDVESIDQIVEKLEKDNGKFSTLLTGIIESAPFQKRRNTHLRDGQEPPKAFQQRADIKTNSP